MFKHNFCKVSQSTPLRLTALLALALVPSAQAQSGGMSVQDLSSAQNPLMGSVPQGTATAEPVRLTMMDALDRGLKYNLGGILSEQSVSGAAAQRVRALSALLPQVNGSLSDVSQQLSLVAFGFPITPGEKYIYGPFNVTDMRATVQSNVLNLSALNNYRAAKNNEQAAKFSYRNTRDLVVLAVGYQYLLALTDASRVESAQAQVATAQALYEQAVDLHKAGMVPNIDVLRAQVEMQSQQQKLLVVQNDYDKQLLSVARVLGLPAGQKIELADKMPAPSPVPGGVEESVKQALASRNDYKQAQATVAAAEDLLRAARFERLPSVGFQGDFGSIGQRPWQNHMTYSAGVAVKVPIFEGGRISGDISAADTDVKKARAQAEDLRARIEYEVRTASLDVEAATKQLTVATSNLDLARQQVEQSRDRFTAGVTNNLEVVQAQEARAAAEDSYINSLFLHNFSKLSLARAIGIAEDATRKFLGGK